jgi:hypothetical protein
VFYPTSSAAMQSTTAAAAQCASMFSTAIVAVFQRRSGPIGHTPMQSDQIQDLATDTVELEII